MLKHKLDAKHTQIKCLSFPHRYAYERAYCKRGERVILGIGGNIGAVLRRFEKLIIYFKRSPFVSIIKTSPMLQNPPFGYTEQADFINAVIEIDTFLKPLPLLAYLLKVERHFGRKRSFQDAPRTLDIDILFYGNTVMNTPRLILPHHGWAERKSVLLPLVDLQRIR